MTNEHPQADLLRLAANNKDQLFECNEYIGLYTIKDVLVFPTRNWRPVKPEPKKIKRWLWAHKDGFTTPSMHTEEEIKTLNDTYTIKLVWSETEFEVNDE